MKPLERRLNRTRFGPVRPMTRPLTAIFWLVALMLSAGVTAGMMLFMQLAIVAT